MPAGKLPPCMVHFIRPGNLFIALRYERVHGVPADHQPIDRCVRHKGSRAEQVPTDTVSYLTLWAVMLAAMESINRGYIMISRCVMRLPLGVRVRRLAQE